MNIDAFHFPLAVKLLLFPVMSGSESNGTEQYAVVHLGATAGPVEGAEGITSMLQEDPGTTANPGP